MTNWMQTIALVEMSITCACLVIWALQKMTRQSFPLAAKVVLLLAITNLFFWPLGMSLELPLAAYVRGVTGDLSIVTVLLLWSALLLGKNSAPIAFKFAIAIVALVFYPMALGLGMLDPYMWGYSSSLFLIAVLLFALVCGLAHWIKGAWMISFAIIAWSANWHESANLWDYLLDPFLAIWAIWTLITAILQKRREKARSGYLFRPG